MSLFIEPVLQRKLVFDNLLKPNATNKYKISEENSEVGSAK